MQRKRNAKMKAKNMKTRRQIVRIQLKFIVRHFAELITLFVGGLINVAGASDLKTFTPEENYVVEGLSIVLTQKLGEVTVKLGSAVNDPTSLTAANGAKFDRDRELPTGISIYKLESTDKLSEADSHAALDSLTSGCPSLEGMTENQSLNAIRQHGLITTARMG
jgi:hypothetical protein